MSDFDKDNNFGDEFDGFGSNEEGFKKLEELLGQLFGPKDSEPRRISSDDDDALEQEFGQPSSVEVIVKGAWTITITSWKRNNGVTTEKVELEGPTKTIPQEIQDFIKDRINSKGGNVTKKLISSSEGVEGMLDEILRGERNKGGAMSDNDFVNVSEIAKFWFLNRPPEYDELIEDALAHEDYEKAAHVRDKKEAYDTFNQITLDRLKILVENGDFVAIDSIMTAYKSKLPTFTRL